MKGKKAIAVMLVSILVAGAQAAGRQGLVTAAGAYQLTVQIPPVIRKGRSATLILNVQKGDKPVDQLVTCLATAPVFVSLEDAVDTTPAGGIDLGTGSGFAARPTCTTALAGEQSGPGTYVFTWEPDTAGRVNLTFTAGAGSLTVPVDVRSTPPNVAVLILFVVFVAAVLITAAGLRRRLRPGKAAA